MTANQSQIPDHIASEIFRRINEVDKGLGEKIQDLTNAVTTQTAHCELCQPIVMGNGKPSISDRVTVLETARSIRAKFDWAIAGAIGSMIAVVVGWVPKLLKWW